MNEEQLRLLERLNQTQEGKDFVEQILKKMLSDNHRNLLNDGKTFRDELIGFGNCIAYMIDLIENSSARLATQKQEPPTEWL